MHDVLPVPRTLLSAVTKSGPLTCSSHHHQGIDAVGEGLVAAGHSSDGLVEAIQLPVPDPDLVTSASSWMLGVQWHPEETAAQDPAQQSLFEALSSLARLRSTRARPGETQGHGKEYGLVEHDPAWAARFEREAQRFRRALPADLVSRIDHVGSTAVPGLAAKPTVDIQLSLNAMWPRSAYLGPLVELGYRWSGGDPWDDEHEFFILDEEGERVVQVHTCAAGGDWERRHLAFRDTLRTDLETAAAYERLKRNLASAHPRDVMAYVDGKTPFIREVERRVLSETSTQG